MASINNGEAAAAAAAAGNKINPLLLASARVGSWEALDILFQTEDAQEPPMMIPTEEFLALLARARGRIAVPDTRDVELGVYRQPASPAAGELLKGVTPGGDNALHAVASSGDRMDFLKYASKISGRDSGLLFVKNHNGDTPLHCAARAGNSKMASLLIGLAGRERPHGKLTLLRMENKLHETALHQAVRTGEGRILHRKDREALFDADGAVREERIKAFVEQQQSTIVKLLMRADPELANYPAGGISPLYLAILLEKSTIAVALYCKSAGNLSYSGADGQNALHVALLRDRVMIELLLNWNMSLTAQVDKDGSTPLHFASSVFFSTASYRRLELLGRPPWCRFVRFQRRQVLGDVLKASPAAKYQADKNGFFPIHVAASVIGEGAIHFLQQCPDSAGLRDAKGKTFLHVAIEKRRLGIVTYACRDPSLAWILNMQDNDGNTPLHLAIQAGSVEAFGALIANRQVSLNLTNNQGETPLDLSRSKLPPGVGYAGNSENQINYTLRSIGAINGAVRWDKTEEKYSSRSITEQEDKELLRLKDTTQSYMVASVLIATMAFTATFAIPGGYRADDHTNGGTPTLAGRFVFDAFIVATTLAFICSSLATVGFMFAGIPMVNLITRQNYLIKSIPFMAGSVTCLCLAFALALYMVLAPVARNTAFVVCAIISALPLYMYKDGLQIMVTLARPIYIRKGLKLGMEDLLHWSESMIANALWPFVLSFGWATLARKFAKS